MALGKKLQVLLGLALGVSAGQGSACMIRPVRLTVVYLPSQYTAGSTPQASFLPRVTDSAQPYLGWQCQSLAALGAAVNLSQSAYQVVVASRPELLPARPDIYDSGVVQSSASVAVQVQVPALPSRSRVFWTVQVWDGQGVSCGYSPEVGAWEVPLLTSSDWQGAQWITRDAQPHPPPADCDYYQDDPAPLLRRSFALAQAPTSVLRARLYITGLGYFLPSMDGQRIGDEALAPAWTDYNKTVLYSTHDVTQAVSNGSSHVLGITLGRGWWDVAPLLFWGHKEFRAALPTGDPMALALLAIDYTDGSTQFVKTEASSEWSVGGGELLFNSIYLGTRVDRRLEPIGWDTPAFNATSWPTPRAAVVDGLGTLTSQRVPPVRKQAPLPVTQLLSVPGQRVLDIGRQIAGVCNFCFTGGAAGKTVHMRYGELLYPNGSVNGLTSAAGQIKNGNGGSCAPMQAFQEDHYTLRGDAGGECYTPPFTWHGARYIAVFGDDATLATLSVSSTMCYPMRSDVAVVGSFSSSSPLLTSIHAASVNTAECNMMSVQSDCPHRERLGYGGDALMSGESLISNFDMSLFYEKRLRDYADAQRSNGGLTETAPFVGISDAGLGGGSGPIGWQTFLPAAAMWLYKYYGNAQAIAGVYAAATAYVEFLDAAPESGIENGLGDWMTLEPSALPLTGLGFQHISYLEYANMSLVVGNVSQAAKYSAAAAAIAAKINAKFLDTSTGVYAAAGVFNATQCGQAMPLFLRIVPEDVRPAATAVLLRNLASKGGHLSVGSFGVKYLLMALVDAGRGDLAWGVMNTTSYPGFGYMIDGTANNVTNATTIWESWFTSEDTYSHNHPMFTSNEVWAYQGLAGLQPHPEAGAWDRVLIKPAPPLDGTLQWVNATIQTPRGVLSSAWTYYASNNTLALTVCVPPNMRAEVWLPISGVSLDPGSCCGCTYWDA